MSVLQELQSIVLLSYLKNDMLLKIAGITQEVDYKAGEFVFREGDFAEYLYAVKTGKVSLEIDKDSSRTIRFQNVAPNFVFGISSMVDTEQKTCISHARALTDINLFRWKAADLEKLFYEDYELGFFFMKRVAKVLKTRWQVKNAQMAGSY